MGYFRRLFIDRRYKENEDPDDYLFIPARVTDNKHLMAQDPYYIKMLENLPPKLRSAWLDGDWHQYEGQFFEEFREEPDVRAALEHGCDMGPDELRKARRWTHVIEPFKVPKGWEMYRSFDWGYHHPFACGYWAVDYEGVIYRVGEFYGVQYAGREVLPNEGLKWAPDRVFSEIRKYETEKFGKREIHGVADPAIWDAETGESIADVAARHQVYFVKGDHARIPGWMQCHYRLQFDDNGYPRMYVFSTCENFIRTVPLLQYDQHKPEDIDTDSEDHIADEWRYFCMTRPIKPVLPEEVYEPMYGADPLEQFNPNKPTKVRRMS